jgi:glycine/serine hydroxymethyltransferase
LIAEVLEAVAQGDGEAAPEAEASVRAQVEELCARFPIY